MRFYLETAEARPHLGGKWVQFRVREQRKRHVSRDSAGDLDSVALCKCRYQRQAEYYTERDFLDRQVECRQGMWQQWK